MKLPVFIIVQMFLSTLCFADYSHIPPGYHSIKTISLNRGNLELLLDKRVNQKTKLEEVPVNAQNAMVLFFRSDGSLVSRKLLNKPRADIQLLNVKTGDKTFFFITEDWSLEFGSYNGPISRLYSLEGENLVEAETKIELMRSLKTNWKVKKKGRGGFPEIFEVSCRPDLSDDFQSEQFKITYSHFLFDGIRWKRKKRELNGFWENEGDFPSEKLFP